MFRPRRLTWNQVVVYVSLTMLLCTGAGWCLMSLGIHVSPPWFQYTAGFYLLLWLPVVLVLGWCIRRRPVGKGLILIALPAIVTFFLWLRLGSISLVTTWDIESCVPGPAGWITRQDCVCRQQMDSSTIQVECQMDGVKFSPFVRLTETR